MTLLSTFTKKASLMSSCPPKKSKISYSLVEILCEREYNNHDKRLVDFELSNEDKREGDTNEIYLPILSHYGSMFFE